MPKRSHEVLPLCEKICVYRKKYIRFDTSTVSGIHWGSWGVFITDKRVLLNRKMQPDVILQKVFGEKKIPYTWLIKFQ